MTSNPSTILTDRLCEKRVTSRLKMYDRKCRGLYVSIIPATLVELGPPARRNDWRWSC